MQPTCYFKSNAAPTSDRPCACLVDKKSFAPIPPPPPPPPGPKGAAVVVTASYKAGVAVGETVILLHPLSIHVETPTEGRGGAAE